jgi:hypothetical protein
MDIAWWQLPTVNIPLPLGSQTVFMLLAAAAHNNYTKFYKTAHSIDC